jgi:hypothetical protein
MGPPIYFLDPTPGQSAPAREVCEWANGHPDEWSICFRGVV